MEMNGTVFTPSAKYLDEFSVTAKQITDIGGYISDEDMEKIRAYRDHENQKILENDYYGDE